MTDHLSTKDRGFGIRPYRPRQPKEVWLTEEDKWRLANFGLSLCLAGAIAFIVGVVMFRSLPL